jgi:transcriptional regulator with XRE-family HTH domain
MRYADLLKESITKADLSLPQISRRLKKCGTSADKVYLSKLQNGKLPPARDKLNDALAEVLGINPIEFKAAAYAEKIPPEILLKLKEINV